MQRYLRVHRVFLKTGPGKSLDEQLSHSAPGKGPQRRPQERLGRRLEEVAEAVGGGDCRLQMPLILTVAVRGTVAGRRLGPLEGGGGGAPPFPMHSCSTSTALQPWRLCLWFRCGLGCGFELRPLGYK